MKPKTSFFKGLVTGIITMLILSSTVVFAGGITRTIEVVLNSVNLALNGETIASANRNFTLSNGNEVPYSIVYKGTTYLPVRKLAEALSKQVTWDGNTQTIGLVDGDLAPTSKTKPGWNFVRCIYYPAKNNGKQIEDSGYIDKIIGTGNKGNFNLAISRTDAKQGIVVASGKTNVQWTEPEAFYAVGSKPAISLSSKIVDDGWGIGWNYAAVRYRNKGDATNYEYFTVNGAKGAKYAIGHENVTLKLPDGVRKVENRDTMEIIVGCNAGGPNQYQFIYYYKWQE